MDRRLKILIVDDKPDDCKILRRYLTRNNEGAPEIDDAATAELGFLRFTESSPDCVLLDYNLPDMNGLELLEALRARTGRSSLPVVMMTGLESRNVAAQALSLGAMDFLLKDLVTPAELHRVVENAVLKSETLN